MTPLLDLSDQRAHLVDVMLAILQPALWLLLCAGFVLASAHLLTMLGTRWGDRRVSPKAFLFSAGVHLSLVVAVIAMIPEYRQHILSLGRDDPPVTIELQVAPEDASSGGDAGGGVPVWDRIPDPLHRVLDRSRAEDAAPSPDPQTVRPAAIQLADARPLERLQLPDAPRELPVPMPPAELTPSRAPAQPPLPSVPTPDAAAEARPEASVPRPLPQRTAPDAVAPRETAEQTGRPPALASIAQRPASRSRQPAESLASPLQPETPSLASAASTPRPALDRPAPLPLPTISPNAPSTASTPAPAGPAAGPPRAARARTQVAIDDNEVPELSRRPGLIPSATDPLPRERERMPLPDRRDPALPDLYRPGVEQGRAAAPEALARVPASFGLRTDQERKDEAIRRYGGTAESQKAVERALRWLADMQERDGRWSAVRFDAGNGPAETDAKIADRRLAGRKSDTGVSALVILALLGNGNSLSSGPYSAQVDRAVRWLISKQAADGSLAGDATVFEAMYCHGMATLALAEAYAMETDVAQRAVLRPPLERALQFSASTQLEDGGWRYLARQLGGGDMSMFGWQLMAFRSAQDAGIPIPEKTRLGMIEFLKSRSRGSQGGLAGYRADEAPTPAMTAEALFSKQMLGMQRDNPMAAEATRYLLQNRPRLAELNLYYWYYGTLAMFQHGGTEWEQWNLAQRDLLISEQVASGPHAGSWEPKCLYSRYGGRLFSTAIAALCLEVYYRRLPMYQWSDPARSAP